MGEFESRQRRDEYTGLRHAGAEEAVQQPFAVFARYRGLRRFDYGAGLSEQLFNLAVVALFPGDRDR